MGAKESKPQLALYGAIGAIAPDILILYSKRWTMSGLAFSWFQYGIATLLYVVLAAIVATIFPYKGKPSRWKAFVVGICLPVFISGIAYFGRAQLVSPRSGQIVGTLWDLLSLF